MDTGHPFALRNTGLVVTTSYIDIIGFLISNGFGTGVQNRVISARWTTSKQLSIETNVIFSLKRVLKNANHFNWYVLLLLRWRFPIRIVFAVVHAAENEYQECVCCKICKLSQHSHNIKPYPMYWVPAVYWHHDVNKWIFLVSFKIRIAERKCWRQQKKNQSENCCPSKSLHRLRHRAYYV